MYPRLSIRLGKSFGQHLHGDVIGDVAAFLQDCLDPFAEVGSFRDMVPEHLARRNVRDAEPLGNEGRLSPLACTWRPDEEELHHDSGVMTSSPKSQVPSPKSEFEA